MSQLKLWGLLGAFLALCGLAAWISRIDNLRDKHLADLNQLTKEGAVVLAATRKASDNPKLKWRDVPEQITEIAASRKGWKDTAQLQASRIDALNQETLRLQALAAAERKKAEAAIAKRDQARRKLEQMALSPGDRSDCEAQLRDAESALDDIYRAGF